MLMSCVPWLRMPDPTAGADGCSDGTDGLKNATPSSSSALLGATKTQHQIQCTAFSLFVSRRISLTPAWQGTGWPWPALPGRLALAPPLGLKVKRVAAW